MALLFLLLFCGDWCVSVAEEAVIAKWDSSSESGLQMLSKVNLAAGVTLLISKNINTECSTGRCAGNGRVF